MFAPGETNEEKHTYTHTYKRSQEANAHIEILYKEHEASLETSNIEYGMGKAM